MYKQVKLVDVSKLTLVQKCTGSTRITDLEGLLVIKGFTLCLCIVRFQLLCGRSGRGTQQRRLRDTLWSSLPQPDAETAGVLRLHASSATYLHLLRGDQ